MRAALLALAIVASTVPAQSRREPAPSMARFGEYTVYYNAVESTVVPASVAREHGIPAGEDTVLLVVAVEKDGANIPAEVAARATNLAAQITEIEMREVTANDMVSYIGTIDVEYRSTVDFRIAIGVEGAEAPFVVDFRDNFP